jgi:hypothetical protein
MRRIHAVAMWAASLLLAGAAIAQDVPVSRKTPKPRATATTPAKQRAMSDPDARFAIGEAKQARVRARCLTTGAAKLERAARSLEAAPELQKIALLEKLVIAEEALEQCTTKKKYGDSDVVRFGPMTVESPYCEPSDPLCSDIVSTDTAPVVNTVKAKRTHFRICYEKARKKNPKLTGQLGLRAQLAETTDGRASAPTSVTIEDDSIADEPLTKCVVNTVNKLRFDKGSAGSVVRFSLGLQPGD